MGMMVPALLLALASQDAVLSGPQPGEKTPAFKVFDLASRQEADYVSEGRGGPAVLVFIHELTRPAAGLMRALDDYGRIKEVRGLRTRFITLTEDRDAAERRMPVVTKSLHLKCPMGISLDGKEGPGAYGLNREVMLTVLVVRGDKVAANFALLSPNETDAPRVKAAVDEVLKGYAAPLPSGPDELRAEVVRLREELAVAREELAALQLKAEKPAPRRGEMERPKEDEQLVNLCRRLIQKQATQEQLDAAVKDIDAYIGANAEFRKQYAAILTRILDLQYGNERGQAEMRRQLEKLGK